MRRACNILWCLFAIVALSAGPAAGQVEPDKPEPAPESEPSKLWAVVGGSQVIARGDCQFCENFGIEDRITHTWGLLGDIGVRVNAKTDVGGEVMWVPATTRDDRPFRATFLLGTVQYRVWESQGFFVKLGMGMALTRNFLDENDTRTQKALAVAFGGGWAFRRDERIGFQVHGALHAAALGDFVTQEVVLENAIGNFWSLGAAIVIR